MVPEVNGIPTGFKTLFTQLEPILNSLTALVAQRTPFDLASTDSNPVHVQLKLAAERIFTYNRLMPAADRLTIFGVAVENIINALSKVQPTADYSAQKAPNNDNLELIETSLRYNLFEFALKKHNEEIALFINADGFPDGLKEREEALYKFVTKGGHYLNLPSIPYLYQPLVDQGKAEEIVSNILTSILQKATGKMDLEKAISAYEPLISKELEKRNLGAPSIFANGVESEVRYILTETLLLNYVDKFQEDFTLTADMTFVKLTQAVEKLKMFLSKNQTFPLPFPLEASLIAHIFDLEADEPKEGPFSTVIKQIEADRKNALILLSKTPAPQPIELPSYLSKLNKPLNKVNKIVKEYREGPASTKEGIEAFAEKRTRLVEAARTRYLALAGFPSAAQSTSVIMNDAAPSQPAAQPQPPVPAAALSAPAPAVQMPRVYTANDFEIPRISYVDIAFRDLFKKGEEAKSWDSLGPIVQLDVLRHLSWLRSYPGRAEEYARKRFPYMNLVDDQIKILEGSQMQRNVSGVDSAFAEKGEAFLNERYRDLSNRIDSVPLEPVFLRYVYEMAKEAGVEIAEWDHDFAKNNYSKNIGMIGLSVQALERRLHTQQ